MRLVAWPKVICFGDSLTQFGWSLEGGWVSKISDLLVRRCDVINRGFSGYTSRLCRAMMTHVFGDEPRDAGDDLGSDEVAMVILLLGANDSNNSEGVQHVPVAEFKENMTAIVDGFLSRGVKRDDLILLTPPPVSEAKFHAKCREMGNPITKFLKDIPPYVGVVREIAATHGIACVDLFAAMTAAEDWETFFNDGLHLSESGAEFVAAQVTPTLQKRMERWPVRMPDWKDVDHQGVTPSTFG